MCILKQFNCSLKTKQIKRQQRNVKATVQLRQALEDHAENPLFGLKRGWNDRGVRSRNKTTKLLNQQLNQRYMSYSILFISMESLILAQDERWRRA